ncbi:LCP family protein [Arsenicicoccus dermatophilus]|uniref:LCP family protein n=1 Tax=Arsenicicoccus dermatophilus TaxID=1076331 RepID=UPI00240A7D7C|nr:LCP family protein [Arsenicicoccus dermatophilus]
MTAEEEKALSTGDAEGQRTDSIILVHVFGTGQKPVAPRDHVPIPGHRKNKINAAFALGGPKLLVATVEGVTGIRRVRRDRLRRLRQGRQSTCPSS